jgi:hypothetical protein
MAKKAGARSPHEGYYYYRGTRLEAVRSGAWKLRKTKETELYNLRDDISEKQNLATEHPEIVRRLTEMMEAFDRDLKANARPPGRVLKEKKA